MIADMTDRDLHCLRAAQGWAELGNYDEAAVELEGITAALRSHPEALVVSWKICAHVKQWPACVEIGEAIVQLAPQKVFGWIHRSFALHELKRTREAFDLLLPAVEKYPKEWTIPYNLACYACQLGELKEAWSWLEKAIDLAGESDIRPQALSDPDLGPMWGDITDLKGG